MKAAGNIGASRSLAALTTIGFALMCTPAHAYYLPLLFEPATPVAGQVAQVVIRAGQCDALAVFGTQDRQVSVSGNTVAVTVNGTTAISFPFCIYPDVTVRVDLVPLPAGTYRVQLFRREITVSGVVDLVATADLVVGPAPAPAAAAVPTIGVWGIGALAFLLALVGVRRQFN